MKVQKVLELCALMENKKYVKNMGIFFSPFMRFLHYAVFKKLKTHKPRTKCTLTRFVLSDDIY